MGTHYTLLRYTCPLFFILTTHRIFEGGGARSRVNAASLAVVFTAILLLISPETAIAFAFACAVIFLLSTPSLSSSALATFAGFLLTVCVVFWAALKCHVLDTVKASGGGADSFPVAFAPHILLFFASLFVCACYTFRRVSERCVHDNTIGLIAFSIPMIAAALGRCDPGHVLLNGLGIFLASMFYMSNYRIGWKCYKAVFAVVLFLIPALSATWLLLPSLARCGFDMLTETSENSWMRSSLIHIGRVYVAHFAGPAKRAKFEKALENSQHLGIPDTIEFTITYPTWHGTFLAPLGYKPNGLGTYLSNQVDYGHFEGFENANTVDAIHEKLAEIKQNPEKALLLPDHFERTCQIDVPTERLEISLLFAFPYFGKAVHPESVRQPICDYILANYRLEQWPTSQNFWYGLWIAKQAGGQTSRNGISAWQKESAIPERRNGLITIHSTGYDFFSVSYLGYLQRESYPSFRWGSESPVPRYVR